MFFEILVGLRDKSESLWGESGLHVNIQGNSALEWAVSKILNSYSAEIKLQQQNTAILSRSQIKKKHKKASCFVKSCQEVVFMLALQGQ